MVKRLPAMQRTRVQSLGREDTLEKEMATHSSTHAWKIPWMEKPGGLQSVGSQRVGHNCATSLSFFFTVNHLNFMVYVYIRDLFRVICVYLCMCVCVYTFSYKTC